MTPQRLADPDVMPRVMLRKTELTPAPCQSPATSRMRSPETQRLHAGVIAVNQVALMRYLPL